jgi:hypothetical protein
MNIPAGLLKRLAAQGEEPDLGEFSKIHETRGAEFFESFLRSYVEGREESESLFRRWSPKLRVCRRLPNE